MHDKLASGRTLRPFAVEDNAKDRDNAGHDNIADKVRYEESASRYVRVKHTPVKQLLELLHIRVSHDQQGKQKKDKGGPSLCAPTADKEAHSPNTYNS